MKKATRQQTKSHNTRLILKTIYDHGNVSRADIARLTRLTRPTVSSIVAELMARGLVTETGQGPSAGGKRPTWLDIVDDAQLLICIDLGSQLFRGAVVNLRGEIVTRQALARNDETGADALALVVQLLDGLVAAAGAPILGIGVGTPGLVDPAAGVVKQAVNLGWSDVRLRDLLGERYDTAVYVANDSHLAALAEYTYGPTRDSRHLILVKVGQGIGAGIVINGQLLVGDGFGAGEIGHVVVAENGLPCSCGNAGCLETIASTRAILKRAAGTPLARQGAPSWEQLVADLHAGDPDARLLVQTAGGALGASIAAMIGSFNIRHVVISGRVSLFGAPFLDAVRAGAARRVLPAMAAETAVSFSELGTDIVILGSSAMVLRYELGII